MRSYFLVVLVATVAGPSLVSGSAGLLNNVLFNKQSEGSGSNNFGTSIPVQTPANPAPPKQTDDTEEDVAPGVGRPANFITANESVKMNFRFPDYDYFIKWPAPILRRTEHFYNLISQTLDPTGMKNFGGLITDPSEFQEFCRRLPSTIHVLKDYAWQMTWHQKISKAVLGLVLDSVHQKYISLFCKNKETIKKYVSDNEKINSHIDLLSDKLNTLLQNVAAIRTIAEQKRPEAASYACCVYLDYKKNISESISDAYVRNLILDRFQMFYGPSHDTLCYGGKDYSQIRFNCKLVDFSKLVQPTSQSISVRPKSLHMSLLKMMANI